MYWVLLTVLQRPPGWLAPRGKDFVDPRLHSWAVCYGMARDPGLAIACFGGQSINKVSECDS